MAARNGISDPLFNLHEYHCNIKTREIYLQSDSSSEEEVGVDFRMANTFSKNLHLLNSQNSKPILVHMHTIGGEWNDGIAIYDNLSFSNSPVTILAHAHARSMSSIILQGAQKRVLMPNCDVMVHYGSYADDDTYKAVKSGLDYTERLTANMLMLYAKKCIQGPYFKSKKIVTLAKVITFLKKQLDQRESWWMDAEEAVDYGFADGILGREYQQEDLQKG